ncbi:MAG: NAD(P)H-dependent oxidoreductase subunit E [Planctomycetota bacterium]
MIAPGRTYLTDEMVAKIEALAPRYPNRQALTLPALHIVNAALRHVPLGAVAEIAAVLGLAPAEVQDTLTFYQFFHQEKPHGKVRAFVCRSVSCALRGGDQLLEHLCAANRIEPYGTTADGELTIESAEGLWACDFAPCILANDDLLKNVTPEAAEAELKKPRARAT